MSTKTVPDNWPQLFDQVFGRHARALIAERHALKLAKGEFKLSASLHGMSFVTMLNRSRRLAHFEHYSYSVWRRGSTGPQVVRIVSRALCGQWIMQAKRADWFVDDPRCVPCERALHALIEAHRAAEVNS